MHCVIESMEEFAAQNPKFSFLWGLRFGGIRDFSYFPPAGSPLWDSDRPLRLAVDQVVAPTAYWHNAWEPEELQFVKEHLAPGRKYLLVDVGANMGLVTRQILAAIDAVQGAICYEPHPGNFDCLRFNVSHRNVRLLNAGLGSESADLRFYLDPANCGNFSLNADALADTRSETMVKVLDARGESLRWLELEASAALGTDQEIDARGRPEQVPDRDRRRFIYKSDTQGFDELIATRIAGSFWSRVDVAMLEMWRIAKPSFDAAALAALLDSFPNRVFLRDPASQLSTGEVMDFLAGRDRNREDLGMWR